MSDNDEDHITVSHHESAIWSVALGQEANAHMCGIPIPKSSMSRILVSPLTFSFLFLSFTYIASIGSEDLKVTLWRKDESMKVSSNTDHILCTWIPTDMAVAPNKDASTIRRGVDTNGQSSPRTSPS